MADRNPSQPPASPRDSGQNVGLSLTLIRLVPVAPVRSGLGTREVLLLGWI
jgi:hypothetical protein